MRTFEAKPASLSGLRIYIVARWLAAAVVVGVAFWSRSFVMPLIGYMLWHSLMNKVFIPPADSWRLRFPTSRQQTIAAVALYGTFAAAAFLGFQLVAFDNPDDWPWPRLLLGCHLAGCAGPFTVWLASQAARDYRLWRDGQL